MTILAKTFKVSKPTIYSWKKKKESIDLVILDPPRNGAGVEVMEEIKRLGFKNLIFISCDLAPLIRDLEVLKETYKIDLVKGFDMFPQTYHLETIACLSKI